MIKILNLIKITCQNRVISHRSGRKCYLFRWIAYATLFGYLIILSQVNSRNQTYIGIFSFADAGRQTNHWNQFSSFSWARSRISQRKEMPALLRDRLPVGSQFAIITCYWIVAKIRLNPDADSSCTSTRVNGSFLSVSAALLSFATLYRSLQNMWASELHLEKLHVAKRQNPLGSSSKCARFFTSSPNFLMAIPRFPSVSRRERAVPKKVKKVTEELCGEKRGVSKFKFYSCLKK